uniref:Uncharacterized protein n=1 Tax=Culex tarsalis TaxID=7177 RepID=A0A1Q3FSX4_CULTA
MSSRWWRQLLQRVKLSGRKKKSVLETIGHRGVTRSQATALLQCLEYVTENISFFGLFLSIGQTDLVDKIYRRIKSADSKLMDYLVETSAPRECAIAMHRFFRTHKISILPSRALSLLSAHNDGMPRRLVALDVLNLIHHESTSGMRLQLATAYLRMMQQLTLRGYLIPNEIRIVISPYVAAPVLFPGRNTMRDIATKSATLLELFLSVDLLDHPDQLSEELGRESARLQRQRRQGRRCGVVTS